MAKLSFCQVNYPQKAVINGDTVCIISISQVDSINVTYIKLDECHEICTVLRAEISNYEELVKTNEVIMESNQKQLEIQKHIIEEKNQVDVQNEEIIKKQKRAIKWLRVERDVLGVAVLILGSILAF